MVALVSCLLLATLTLTQLEPTCGGFIESERVDEYNRRNHQWPPPPEEFKPSTPGWYKLLIRRMQQIERVDDRLAKYNGWVSAIYTGLIAQNFTESGWALTKAPKEIINELRTHLHRGLVNNPATEAQDSCIAGSLPLMVVDDDLNQRVLHALKPIHEAWSGVQLTPNNAYGLRVYRNNSNLNMHVDKSSTHIISSILHVDHDPMSEPWPIVIEDFQGNTNEVILEAGDMLLYESSKCLHGRPKQFNGSWYTSLFIHYYPTYWNSEKMHFDTHVRIPPTWDHNYYSDNRTDDLEVIETSMKEPNCEDQWCALQGALKWSGPATEGSFISTNGVRSYLQSDNDRDEL